MRVIRFHFAVSLIYALTADWSVFASEPPNSSGFSASIVSETDPEKAVKMATEAEIRKYREFSKANDSRYANSGKSPEDRQKKFTEDFEERMRLCRRLNDIALSAPKTHAALEAVLWILSNSYEEGPPAIELARAYQILVRFHGDNPLVVNHALDHSGYPSFERDLLFNGLYAAAKSRESKGLARFALAVYLKAKAESAGRVQSDPDQRFVKRGTGRGNETIVTNQLIPEMNFAYRQNLRFVDTAMMARRSRALFEEVIRDYADVPYATGQIRSMEAALASESPEYLGKPLTTEDQNQIRLFLDKERSSLGERARRILDGSDYLPTGKPAPEIDAETVDGQRLRLSDHKGKVVVLIFWATWCGPCMADIPYEKVMAKKFEGKPVAILGINSDNDRKKAEEAIKTEGIPWPNWYDGDPLTGKIVADYKVDAFPTTVVIDHNGIVRFLQERREVLNNLIDGLLAEMESPKPD